MAILVTIWRETKRVLAALIAVAGVRVAMTGYPPQGSEPPVVLFIGGLMILGGVVGVIDPSKVFSSGGSVDDGAGAGGGGDE
jgi:hypothetical protein